MISQFEKQLQEGCAAGTADLLKFAGIFFLGICEKIDKEMGNQADKGSSPQKSELIPLRRDELAAGVR
jgi:hypothetical protein